MVDYLRSVLFGIIEGLTEFLPVSSTAHLRLIKPATGVSLDDPYWKMYDVVIQLGAILAVFVYFRTRIGKFMRTFPKGEAGDRTIFTHPLSLVALAFVVTAVPAFLLSKLISQNLESLWVMGVALLVGGVVMWIVDAWLGNRGSTDAMERIKPWQAVWIGLVQVLSAVFPGTSRSMSTIAAGQLAGLTRPAALEFSFFVSLPLMIAATVYDLVATVTASPGDVKYLGGGLSLHQVGVLAVGMVVSFFVAWVVIAWFMAWVRKHGFVPFAIYRIVLGTAVIIWSLSAAT